MTSLILALTVFSTLVGAGQDVAVVVKAAKVAHHHFFHPVYKHVVKPVGVAIKKEVVR